jgi:hypothetical protein
MLCNINNTNYNYDINYTNEIVLNNNKIIFKNDKIIFNEEYDVIIIDIVNYNIHKQYLENIDEASIIIYDNINSIDNCSRPISNNPITYCNTSQSGSQYLSSRYSGYSGWI